MHVSAQMERERLENELAHNARDYNTCQNWRQGRRRHNSTSRASVHDRRTTEEGRHEFWVFYQSGTRREFVFTPNGLLKGQQNQKEMNEKKEKPNSKISLNEVIETFMPWASKDVSQVIKYHQIVFNSEIDELQNNLFRAQNDRISFLF